MTTKQRKHLANIIGICSILSFLGGCQQETQQNLQTVPEIIETTPTIQNTTDTATTTANETAIQQQVTIHPGCIGCGRCARIAADTFAMQERQASIISQDYANTSAVAQAVSSCPAQVIEIIEA